MSTTTGQASTGAFGKPDRLSSVDRLRGLVIILMALDHVRDFFHDQAWLMDPTDPTASYPALFATRFITHFCAPAFMLLAGMSASLQMSAGKSRSTLAGFLVTRGLWLIVLESTVINFAWNFASTGMLFSIISALGVGMIVLAGLIWAPRAAVAVIAVALIAGHNLLDPIAPADLGAAAPLWVVLHEGGPAWRYVFVVYPWLPWIGVMALGYVLAPILSRPAAQRGRWLLAMGLGMIAAFVVLRVINVYGEPEPWRAFEDAQRTAMSFFALTKYPPSLDFLLVTLGVSLAALPALERASGPFARVLETFGRAPFIFYLAHLYVIHLLALAIGLTLGYSPAVFVNVMVDPTAMVQTRWGFPLWVVYLVWMLVVAALYPLCLWWGDFKRRRRDWWISYF